MTDLMRGQKVRLETLTLATSLEVGVELQFQNSRVVDVSCFGLDASGRLSDERYVVFYNQRRVHDGSLESLGRSGDEERFRVDLQRLPESVRRLVFVATLDGAGAMSELSSGDLRLREGRRELARYSFRGLDFGNEKALMVAEIYFQDGWHVAAMGEGFPGDLRAVVRHLGGEANSKPAPQPAPPPPPPPAPPPPRHAAPPPPPPAAPPPPPQAAPQPWPAPLPSTPALPPVVSRQDPSATLPHEILYPGAFPLLKLPLRQGQAIKAEAGSMVSMSTTIDVEGRLEGGLLGGLGRMLTGEKFFFQTLAARRGPGEVLLAPTMPGDIHAIELTGSEGWSVQKDGFFVAAETVEVATKMQNLSQGLLSGEGFFIIKVGGRGTLFVSSYGAIHPVDIPAGEELIIDNAHLVAWPDSTSYKIEKASAGWISSLTSGEGLVCRFRGPGRVLIQTRNPASFGIWMRQFIPLQQQ
jgi:uncharacterized protein (TIGR00266 family)